MTAIIEDYEYVFITFIDAGNLKCIGKWPIVDARRGIGKRGERCL
jgi:hypothetical protein